MLSRGGGGGKLEKGHKGKDVFKVFTILKPNSKKQKKKKEVNTSRGKEIKADVKGESFGLYFLGG